MNGIGREELAQGFRALGIEPGMAVLLHSSLSSFGHVEGGADTVVDALVDAVGRKGAAVFPTLTGHPGLSPDNPPHIDLRTATCWTGRIPETARKRPDALRSIHPTHSCVAIGQLAEELTSGHEKSVTPCGVLSPYYRVAAQAGRIVLAGCGLESCTTCHTIEELANVGYHLQTEIAHGTCIGLTGTLVETPCLLHSYEGPARDFPALEPLLLDGGLMVTGQIGQGTVRVVDAMGLIETALERLRFDRLYLTSRRTL